MTIFRFLIGPVALVFVLGLLIWVGTRIARIERSRYWNCLVIALILVLFGALGASYVSRNPHLSFLVSLVYLVLPLFLIKWYFGASWRKSILAGVLVGVFWLVLMVLVALPLWR